MPDDPYWEVQENIEYILEQVATRGWVNTEIQADDFSTLRMDARFRDAQLTQIYEQYFLPERHEFEWLVLDEIVREVLRSPVTGYIASSVALGVLGNAAFALLKKLAIATANQFETKLGPTGRERAVGFKKLAADAERITTFFNEHTKARIDEIERETGIPRERLHPIMKLAGLKHYRRQNACYWLMPNTVSRTEDGQSGFLDQ